MDARNDYVQAPQTNIFNNAVETIKDKSSEVAQEIGVVADNAKKTLDYYTSKITVVIGLIFVILLCMFIAYGLYMLIATTIFNQSKIVVAATKVPILANTRTKHTISSFNTTGNGKRRSYTFWIYINDMTAYSGHYKHVWHIGDSVDDIRSASPYVFLDKTENKMFVRFAAVADDSFDQSLSSVQGLTSSQFNKYMVQGIEIPYIPIQRWVHIAIVINENSNGGTVVAYVDGDISKIASTGEIGPSGEALRVTNLNLDKKGDLYIGGNFESVNGPGFSGLIAKVAMFNYDLNDRDVYNDYNEGPLDGFLSSLGLANYGVRSPIYKIV